MLKVIIRRLQCSAIASSQFVNSVTKKTSFSNVKNIKSEHLVALRTFCAIPETNKSSELEEDDNKRKFYNDTSYYFKYISTDPRFSEFLFRKELISQNAHSTSLLFTVLKELSSKSEIVGEDLECLLSHLKTELQNLPLYELLEATDIAFRLYNKKDEEMWEPIRECFDKEFMVRRKSLSFNEIFMICNVLNNFGIVKKFDFIHKCMYKLAFKVGELSHTEFLYYCYILTKIEYINLEKFKYEFLNFINERIQSLNPTELGLVSDALTAIDLTINSSSFQNFMTKVLNEVDNMDAAVIKSICTLLEKIRHVYTSNIQLLIDFQEKLVPMVPNFNNNQLRALVFSGLHFRHLNMALYDEVIKRVKSDISNFNLTSTGRFVFLNAIFNIDDKEFLDMAVNEFERRDNCLRQHLTYLKFLQDLIHFQVYPKNLLEKALSNDVLIKVLKCKIGEFAWASLRWSLEVEKPDFKFPELDEKLYTKIFKKMKFVKYPKLHGYRYDARFKWMLENIYGKNSVYSRKVTFQYDNCCIMRLDKNLKPQEIPKEFIEKGNDFTVRPPSDNHIWVCIFPLNRDYYANCIEEIINYRTKTHIRQISILGYKPICIPVKEWYPHVSKTPTSLAFVEGLINQKMQELTGKVQQTESEK